MAKRKTSGTVTVEYGDVDGAKAGDGRFWDTHLDYVWPEGSNQIDGEFWIAHGDPAVEVPRTPKVAEAIRYGRLVEADAPDQSANPDDDNSGGGSGPFAAGREPQDERDRTLAEVRSQSAADKQREIDKAAADKDTADRAAAAKAAAAKPR